MDKQDDIAKIAQALPELEDMARSTHPRDATLASVILALIRLQPMPFETAGALPENVVVVTQTGYPGVD